MVQLEERERFIRRWGRQLEAALSPKAPPTPSVRYWGGTLGRNGGGHNAKTKFVEDSLR